MMSSPCRMNRLSTTKVLAQQHWLYLLTVSDSYQISQVVQELEMQDHTSEITRKLNRVLDK